MFITVSIIVAVLLIAAVVGLMTYDPDFSILAPAKTSQPSAIAR